MPEQEEGDFLAQVEDVMDGDTLVDKRDILENMVLDNIVTTELLACLLVIPWGSMW